MNQALARRARPLGIGARAAAGASARKTSVRARALALHVSHGVMVFGNKTVVFNGVFQLVAIV